MLALQQKHFDYNMRNIRKLVVTGFGFDPAKATHSSLHLTKLYVKLPKQTLSRHNKHLNMQNHWNGCQPWCHEKKKKKNVAGNSGFKIVKSVALNYDIETVGFNPWYNIYPPPPPLQFLSVE